ncbi:hypothetical protein MBLNU13_g04299t2 [Cladosporium sp. NU13]
MPEMAQRSESLPSNSMRHSSAAAAVEDDDTERDPHIPGSIPPWVHISSSEDDTLIPPPVRPNTRHYKPPPSHYKPGRKWDNIRTAEPPLMSAPIADHQTRWLPFMQSGPHPPWHEQGARLMSPEWMEDNVPITVRGWEEEDEALADKQEELKGFWLLSPEKRERTVRLFWRLLLKNPFIPLIFRIIVLAFSGASLGISARMFEKIHAVNTDNDPDNQCAPRASTYMAIVVGCVAIPYTLYVTWDEYMSKPLGLRSAVAKTSLLLCDLYFIVFSASNLSLAFDALFDRRWACYEDHSIPVGSEQFRIPATCPDNPSICYRQKALGGVLFISLVAWLSTFSISVMRVVEKLR